jgi:methionyl-tRNA synthetase
MVFGLDSEFSEEALIARINADLANDLGNLVSRSLTMVHKYFEGRLPRPSVCEDADERLKNQALDLIDKYEVFMGELSFHKALIGLWEVIGAVNKYIDTMAPWILAESDRQRLSTVIFHIFEALRITAVLIWPFMPETSIKIQEQLGLQTKGKFRKLEEIRRWGEEKPVRRINKAPALFPRLSTGKRESKHRPQKEKKKPGADMTEISLKQFQEIDLRVGTIHKAEKISGSKKLLKITVDMAEERIVVAGLLGHYSEDHLVGKQVLVVANLEPVKLMGVESRGMLLAAKDESGLHLLVPDSQTTAGSKVE